MFHGSYTCTTCIRSFLINNPSLVALLAVVNVKLILRRAIAALRTSPNAVTRQQLRHCHGHDTYHDTWRSEVTPRTGQRLLDVVGDWNGLIRAFKVRHVLVHGVRAIFFDYAVQRAEWALAAANDIRIFSAGYNVYLDARLPVRRR